MSEAEKIEFLSNAMRELFKKNITTISRTDKLTNFGLDSLDIVELQMYYEEKNGVETTDAIKPVITVGDLIELMP